MKSVSKRTWIATALATAIVGLSATAIAQNTTPPAAPSAQTAPEAQGHKHHAERHTERHAERMERMKARMAERQAQLKQSLQLTPAQEPAWNAFVVRMQPQPRDSQAGGREAWASLSTPQRLERMEAMKAQRDQAMDKRHEAIRSFYAQLTPEQQKTFDAQGMGGMQRTGMKGSHGKHHQGHGHGHGGPRM
jgi:protein CpxP